MLYEELLEELYAEFPNLAVVPKAESLFMRALNLPLRFLLGTSFMRDYTTTIGSTIYTPTTWESSPVEYRLEVLRHERVHLRQIRRYGALFFSLAYLFFPLPFGLAWCRARLEWEAYEESMRATAEYFGAKALNERHKAAIVGLFVGPAYGWMWPFRTDVERWYDEARARILLGL